MKLKDEIGRAQSIKEIRAFYEARELELNELKREKLKEEKQGDTEFMRKFTRNQYARAKKELYRNFRYQLLAWLLQRRLWVKDGEFPLFLAWLAEATMASFRLRKAELKENPRIVFTWIRTLATAVITFLAPFFLVAFVLWSALRHK